MISVCRGEVLPFYLDTFPLNAISSHTIIVTWLIKLTFMIGRFFLMCLHKLYSSLWSSILSQLIQCVHHFLFNLYKI